METIFLVGTVIALILAFTGLVMFSFCIYVVVSCMKRFTLDYWITKAVNVAETQFTSGQGVEKKEFVLNFIKEKDLKYGVSDEQLDVIIESAVYELNLKQGKKSKAKSAPTSAKKVNKTLLVEKAEIKE